MSAEPRSADAAPLVSVVLPVHDAAEFLAEAVESILRQTFGDLELVVVDDGSSDGSAAILGAYAAQDPRVRIHSQPNRGIVDALNVGCALARGRFIARMDADDRAVLDRLERQVAFLQVRPDVAVLGGAVYRTGPAGRVIELHRPPLDDTAIRAVLSRRNCFTHPAVMLRREAFEQAGGYRTAFRHAEEYDLWLRIAEHWRLANLPDPVLFYRVHAGQLSSSHVRAQALGAMAARRSAHARRRGAADPFAGAAELTPDMFDEPDRVALEAAVRQAHLGWARLLAAGGNGAAARAQLEAALRLGSPSPGAIGFAAEVCRIRARIQRGEGRPVRALAVRALAAAMSVGLLVSLRARPRAPQPEVTSW